MNLFKEADSSILSNPEAYYTRDSKLKTPIHYLAQRGCLEILEHPKARLLKDEKGITPLHELGAKGRKEILKDEGTYLIKDSFGQTPLHYLVANTFVKVSELPKSYLDRAISLEYSEKTVLLINLVDNILATPEIINFN